MKTIKPILLALLLVIVCATTIIMINKNDDKKETSKQKENNKENSVVETVKPGENEVIEEFVTVDYTAKCSYGQVELYGTKDFKMDSYADLASYFKAQKDLKANVYASWYDIETNTSYNKSEDLTAEQLETILNEMDKVVGTSQGGVGGTGVECVILSYTKGEYDVETKFCFGPFVTTNDADLVRLFDNQLGSDFSANVCVYTVNLGQTAEDLKTQLLN